MATETISDFLARGGSVEKTTESVSLAELLQQEGVLNQGDAENVTKNLHQSLMSSLDNLGVTQFD